MLAEAVLRAQQGGGEGGEGGDPLSSLFDLSLLKFKERDDLVEIFRGWSTAVRGGPREDRWGPLHLSSPCPPLFCARVDIFPTSIAPPLGEVPRALSAAASLYPRRNARTMPAGLRQR